MGRGGAFIFGIGRRHGVRNGLVSESGPLAELLGKRAAGAASSVLKAEILVDLEEGLLAMERPDQSRFFRVRTEDASGGAFELLVHFASRESRISAPMRGVMIDGHWEEHIPQDIMNAFLAEKGKRSWAWGG